MSRFFVSIFLAYLLLLNVLQGSTAITVILNNGDSITGEPLSEDEESVRLKVEYLGEIILPKSHIANWDAFSSSLPGAGSTPTEITIVGGGLLQEEQIEYDQNPSFDWLAFLGEWDSRIQIGLTSQSGRASKSDMQYRFDTNLKRDTHELRIRGEYYYGSANDVKTADSYAARLRWRKNISPGVFYEANSGYSADAIKLIDSNFEQQFGLGTRFIESDVTTLSAGLGASGRWRELANVATEDVVYLVDLFQDWDYRFTERLSLKQDFRMAMPLEEQENYQISFSTAVTSNITESINLSLRYELGYDNSLEEEFREDRRFVSSLGYAF